MSSAEARIDPDMARDKTAKDGLARLLKDVAKQDEASLPLVAVRDIALVSALLSLFAAAQTWATTSGLAFAIGLSVIDGLLVGAAIGGILHEWGHFIGARLGGGHAPLKPIGGFFPVFDFDYKNNDARAFHWMSVGGNAADIALVVLLFLALPMTTPGATALVAGAFGFAVYAAGIEFPVIHRAHSGMTAINALRALPRDFQRRHTRYGLAAALAAFVLL